MSIFGRVLKGTVGLCADGLEYVITTGARGIKHKYGEHELVRTASEIGSSSVRVTESTVKTMADVVDGGIDAGIGYLAKDQVTVNKGWERSKNAGQELVVGFEKGLVYTYEAGALTTSSAVQAGKHYIKGDKVRAGRELGKTKRYAKNFGKVVLVGLLAFGPPAPGDKDKRDD